MKQLWWTKYKKYIYADEIDKAKRLLLKVIPKDKVVYKYFRGINRDWNSIIQPELWLCQAGMLNDPFDCAFLYNCHSKEKYDENTEIELAISEHKKQNSQDKQSKKMQESVFVSCFSEKSDSLLMWSHYGSEHKGLCVGYNLYRLIERYNCFPVIYSKKMPQISVNDDTGLDSLAKVILTKSPEWAYEEEWRIIDIDPTLSGHNGKKIPFEKPVEVYIGTRQKDTVQQNYDRCDKQPAGSTDPNASELFKTDEFFIRMQEIIKFRQKNHVNLYEYDLCRNSFVLRRRKMV